MTKATLHLVYRKNQTQARKPGYIYLRLTINRKSRFYSTGVPCLASNWDPDREVITHKDPEAKEKNRQIEKFFYQYNEVLKDLTDRELDITFDRFTERLNSQDPRTICEMCQAFILEKSKVFAPTTLKRYENALAKIRAFGDLALKNVDYNYLQRFETWLRNTKNNGHNTITKEIKIIKTLYHEGVKRGLVPAGRPLEYVTTYREVNRDFLSMDELTKLYQYCNQQDTPENFRRVLYPFLFACFTGLRVSDIRALRLDNFNDVFTQIDLVTQKTGQRLVLPLSDPSRDLIKDYISFDLKRLENAQKQAVFFEFYSDQHSNTLLANVMIKNGITKTITWHNARYTFATICNQLGIPLAVTSALLTHKTLRMTLQYAKFNDTTILQNVSLWNTLRLEKLKN